MHGSIDRGPLLALILSAALFLGVLPVRAATCSEQVGMAKAKELVDQCLQASPATHPPCNVQNSCDLIRDEIARGCEMFKSAGQVLPAYCLTVNQPLSAAQPAVTTPPPATFQNTAFQTPSKNIFCIFSASMTSNADSIVRCNIGQFTPSFDAAYSKNREEDECVAGGCGCEPKRLSRYHVGSKSAIGENYCPTLDLYDPTDPDATANSILTLNYGAVFQKDGITCVSDQKGLTCTNSGGHGFFLSKAKQAIF